jgi:hypothetical protein
VGAGDRRRPARDRLGDRASKVPTRELPVWTAIEDTIADTAESLLALHTVSLILQPAAAGQEPGGPDYLKRFTQVEQPVPCRQPSL